jgi:hypothetical protein
VPNSPGEVEIIGVEKNFQTGVKTIIFDVFGTSADVIDLYFMDNTWRSGDPSLGGNGSGTQAAAPLPKTKPEQPDWSCFSTAVVFPDADAAFDRILNPPPPPLQLPKKKKYWQ